MTRSIIAAVFLAFGAWAQDAIAQTFVEPIPQNATVIGFDDFVAAFLAYQRQTLTPRYGYVNAEIEAREDFVRITKTNNMGYIRVDDNYFRPQELACFANETQVRCIANMYWRAITDVRGKIDWRALDAKEFRVVRRDVVMRRQDPLRIFATCSEGKCYVLQ